MMQNQKIKNQLKALGPGILFASTCIGVSHLVQSTRAGAEFGFSLLGAVIIANLLKYPFFEFASRYSAATGKTIIDGYNKMGKAYLLIYFIVSVGTMFFVSAAVGFATSGFLQNLFGISGKNMAMWTTAFLFFGSAVVLILGQYNFLDRFIKIIGAVLLLSTVFAFILLLFKGPSGTMDHSKVGGIFEGKSFLFLIALMGWMPTAVDISSWNSLWIVERIKQTGYKPKLREILWDFNFGYVISGLLSIIFLVMGAYLLFGTSESLPDNSAGFANGVINLYSKSMGGWSYYLIAPAAFSIMLGTSIAIFDGYARTMNKCIALLFNQDEEAEAEDRRNGINVSNFFSFMVGILAIGSFLIIYSFSNNPDGFKDLVDFATSLSFIIAPIIAIFNFRLVLPPYIDKGFEPPRWKKVLAYIGVIFLSIFTVAFILFKLGWL